MNAFDIVISHFQNSNYAEAKLELEKIRENECDLYCKAQYYLGLIYYHGYRDEVNAIKCFKCVSSAIDALDTLDAINANYMLGQIYYYKARNGNKNFIEAISFFEKAAKYNHLESICFLWKIYLIEMNDEKLKFKGLFYLKKAIEFGDNESIRWSKK